MPDIGDYHIPESYSLDLPDGFDADVMVALEGKMDGDRTLDAMKAPSAGLPITVSAGYSFGFGSGRVPFYGDPSQALEFGVLGRPSLYITATPLTTLQDTALEAGVKFNVSSHGHGFFLDGFGDRVHGGTPMDIEAGLMLGYRWNQPMMGALDPHPEVVSGIELGGLFYSDAGTFGPVLRMETSYSKNSTVSLSLGVKGYFGRD
jgi:hypothetical protein